LPAAENLSRKGSGSTQRRVQRLQNLPTAEIILGIDPGLHRTGYGLIEINGGAARRSSAAPRLLEGGVLRARAAAPLSERLKTLYEAICAIIKEKRPEVVVVEELFSTYAHPRSALLMAHVRGVLLLAAAQSGVPVHHFLPNEVKQVLTGNGHATKSAVQAAVKNRLQLSALPEPPDVADALAIAVCMALRQNSGLSSTAFAAGSMPGAQQKALREEFEE
jgi:crossover junction endodeoxyribonuclease RuvC